MVTTGTILFYDTKPCLMPIGRGHLLTGKEPLEHIHASEHCDFIFYQIANQSLDEDSIGN